MTTPAQLAPTSSRRVERLFLLLTVLLIGFVQVNTTHALSLGRLSGVPILGQAFTGSVAATLSPGERLDSDCVKAELYNGEDKIAPNNVGVEVVGEGENRQIRVRSLQRLTEPLLTVYLEAGCQGRISRRYTLFVDPLTVAAQANEAGNVAQDAPPAEVRRAPEPNPYPPLASSGGQVLNSSAFPPVPARQRNRQQAVQPAAKDINAKPKAVAEKKALPKPKATRKEIKANTAATPKLTLDLASGLEAKSGTAAGMHLTRELSFPVVDEENARRAELRVLRNALMAEIEGKVAPGEFAKRVQQLEQANEKLLKERASAISQAATEKAKREEIERTSFPAWAMYAALGALVAALLGAYVFWRRSQMFGDEDVAEQVFNPQSKTIDVPLNNYADSDEDSKASTAIEVDQLDEKDSFKWYERFVPARRKGISPTDMPVTMPVPGELGHDDLVNGGLSDAGAAQKASAQSDKRLDAQRRIVPAPLTPHEQLAVNEIADISQEAEFFIEIGERERAIKLLESSLETEHYLTPVPQLYLLDLYRDTGKQAEYENLRQKFSERFNAFVPKWDEDASSASRELADYPRALEQVCRSWRSDNIVPTLESLLVDDTRGSRLGFDLPAYREVIFLYGIAKQLELDSENEGYELGIDNVTAQTYASTQVDVDLDLPIGSIDTQPSSSAVTQTGNVKVTPPNTKASSVRQDITLDSRSLDFDLDFEDSKLSKTPPKKS